MLLPDYNEFPEHFTTTVHSSPQDKEVTESWYNNKTDNNLIKKCQNWFCLKTVSTNCNEIQTSTHYSSLSFISSYVCANKYWNVQIQRLV